MLWKHTNLLGREIEAADGTIGAVDDLLFDDRDWTLRWIVVDTGDWLPGRLVILPPSAFGRPDRADLVLRTQLPRERIEKAPGLSRDEPVSRQMEREIYTYWGWSPYWPAAFGAPYAAGAAVPPPAPAEEEAPRGDPGLRSAREVTGYYIHARDGDIGHIEEFLVDDESWAIRYAIVDTANWWPGRMVLIAPRWIGEIDWRAQEARVDLTRNQIETAPEYEPYVPPDRAYEARLHGHYGIPPYWD